ncbi:SusC/RagA family TonB-linked outer membrane protein [Spirosoma endophyticum]|uniref:TonB-linked outer membrane protein, SusC/RagA family n=1 Tax=Spirosoma endophyticum TaxID=662367 RepID=A0A1I1WKB8_9BACT|nr:SusC/RagA family TonB-linked outer membrane protein [Spirosoma endophyticum]SFD93550.1 TonB-linked outer membrane protein, SusC/RagA family [Spirosoma endophyticum]
MKKHLSGTFWVELMRFSLAQSLVMLILIGVSHAHSSNAQEYLKMRLTLHAENQEVKKVLTDIEKATGVQFVYSSEVIEPKQKISIQATNATLEEVLIKYFKPLKVTYELVGRKLVLSSIRPVSNETGFVSPIENPVEEVAPKRMISGKVSDEKGSGLPGVSVLVKGLQRGTTTNTEGNFQLDIPDDGAPVLVFSFVGYEAKEVAVGNQSVLRVSLAPADKSLNEVVVTALGIKKQAKSIGYATSTVTSDQITVNRTANFMNTLQGKIPGVNITSLGSGPAGTSKIRIRGQSSFGGNNSPLIVVNGVPIDNTNYGARGDVSDKGSNRTSDGGDGLSSINPDNIETMTVLKGAAASALYGSRAKDGVIMITTKTRGTGSGIGIEYNTNFTTDTPLDYTDYQYEYGQGENGVRPTAPFPTSGQWSFGEKFQPGMTQILFDGVEVPYVPQRNQITNYYRTGQTWTNTISLSSGGEFGGFNLSVSNMDNKTILPGSGYNRKTVNLGFTQTLAKRLTISGNVNYSNERRTNPPNIAEQDYSPVVLFSMANSMPLDLLEKYASDANGNEVIWSRFTNRTNPYFALKRFENIRNDRVFGNLTARYNFTDWLFLQARVGQDYYSREQDYNLPTGSQRQPAAPAGFVNGQYVQDARNVRELNTDFLIGANKTFGVFGVNVNAGGNQMYRRISRHNVFVQDFYTRNLYTIGNGRQRDATYELSERQVNSLYGSAEVSFKDFLFVNGTVRNDWFSTLSAANRSILYPSMTASFVFSQAFANVLPGWLTFGKIRAAYAEVGSDTDVQPYANNLFYGINSQQFPSPGGTAQPLASISGSTVPNANLRPMRVSEKEVGLELKLFNNRVGLDLTYYDKLSSDQILRAQTSDAGGYLTQLINVGQSQNRGLEMLLTFSPMKRPNFNWDVNFNAAYNVTKVLDLGSSVSDNMITVGTGDFSGELRQVVGLPMGQLFGFGYLRDAQGRQVFDAGNGRPLRTATQIPFGSALPKWVGGITNSFTYKGINLSFLIDFKLGNKMISGTNHNAWRHGLHKATLVGRAENFVIGDGVNPNGEVNRTKSGVQAYYETVRSQNIAEEFVYDAGLWQLRQITIGYDFTKFLPTSGTFVKGIRLNAVANNVAVIKKWVPNIHPEQFGFPSDNLIGLEATGLPVTRSIGFNLNVKF